MPEDTTQQKNEHTRPNIGPISWWSWRPGIQPRNALVIGGLITLIALQLGGIGLIALIAAILDSVSSPLQVPGLVLKHAVNSIDGEPRLIVRLHVPGFPAEVSPVVTSSSFNVMHNGDVILLDYTPRLHVLYAVEKANQHYTLPGASTVGVFIGSVALVLLGIALLPYPAALTRWSWLDLFGRHQEQRHCEMTGQVVGLRAALQTRAGRTGLIPHASRAWYGVALYSSKAPSQQQIMTFAISQSTFKSLHEGELVHIRYSAHLHYVYALEQAS